MNLLKQRFFLLSLSLWPHLVYHVPVCSHFLSSPAKLSTTTDVGLPTGRQLGEGAPWTERERGREQAHCSWRMRPVFQRQVRFCPKVVIRRRKHFTNSLLTCTHANTRKRTLWHKNLRQTAQQNDDKLRGLPQLFGIVLLNLCPLLHKFHILLHQLQARLCVLLNDVVLVLEKGAWETNKEKILSQHSAGRGTWVITGMSHRLNLR